MPPMPPTDSDRITSLEGRVTKLESGFLGWLNQLFTDNPKVSALATSILFAGLTWLGARYGVLPTPAPQPAPVVAPAEKPKPVEKADAELHDIAFVDCCGQQPEHAKAKPAEKVYPTGLVVPDDIKQRVAASWGRHGAKLKLMAGRTVAAKWDAEDYGWDSPVDDQGNCGSCHLFAGTGAAECAQIKEGHVGVTLSKQQVMDCANTGDCNGGWPEDTLAYAKKVGLATTAQYGAYKERRSTCKSLSGMKVYKLKDYGYVTREDGVPSYQELKDAMAKYGPLSVCVARVNVTVLAFWTMALGLTMIEVVAFVRSL